jgi:2-polyprenyl-3-methyl-5-hydroxy-6-metoxy-1,4-benzoquinol methylase
MQELRHGDGTWLLKNLNMPPNGPHSFEGFTGSVLEVGCGPIGFFELTEGVEVLAIDSLMAAYAREIPYSTLGRRGSSTYAATLLQDITDKFRFVVCSNVLDHTADWMEFLELLANRVEPNGQLLLMSDTRGYPAAGHTQVFTPSQCQRALRWLGLTKSYYFRFESFANAHADHRVFARAARA